MVSGKHAAFAKAPRERSTLLDWFFARSSHGKTPIELPLGDSIVVAPPDLSISKPRAPRPKIVESSRPSSRTTKGQDAASRLALGDVPSHDPLLERNSLTVGKESTSETPSTAMEFKERGSHAEKYIDEDQENNNKTITLSDQAEGNTISLPSQLTTTRTRNSGIRKRSASLISTSSDFNKLDRTPPSKVAKITMSTSITASTSSGTRLAEASFVTNSDPDSPLSIFSQTPSFPTKDESAEMSSIVSEESSQATAGFDEDVLEGAKPNNEWSHKDRDKVYESDSSLDDLTELLGVRQKYSDGMPDRQSLNTPDTNGDFARSRRSFLKRSTTAASITLAMGTTKKIHTPSYKHSLSSLIKQKERDCEAEAETEKANQVLMTAEHTFEAGDNSDSDIGDLMTLSDARLLDAIVPAGDDKAAGQRIIKAVERTEALHSTKRWSFFCGRGNSNLTQSTFCDPPRAGLPPGCGDSRFRDQCFTTGLSLQWFHVHLPSQEMFHWLWDSACSEVRQDLSMSYRAACMSCHHSYASKIDTTFLRTSFLSLGVAAASVDVQQEVSASSSRPSEIGAERENGLLRRLGLIQDASRYMSQDANVYCVEVLLRMGIDKVVEGTASLYAMIQNTISTIIDVLFERNLQQAVVEMCESIFDRIESAELRVAVLNLLNSDTVGLCAIRQALALGFFTGQRTQTNLFTRTTESITSQILKQLDSSALYRLTATTEYRHLSLSISMLDVAIDDALVPDFQLKSDITREEIGAAKVTFDGHIDTITKRVRRLFTHIVDGGVGNMARTEAKAVVERLLYRLDYAVRTRPPLRKSGLGHDIYQASVTQPQTSLMAKFMVRKSKETDRAESVAAC